MRGARLSLRLALQVPAPRSTTLMLTLGEPDWSGAWQRTGGPPPGPTAGSRGENMHGGWGAGCSGSVLQAAGRHSPWQHSLSVQHCSPAFLQGALDGTVPPPGQLVGLRASKLKYPSAEARLPLTTVPSAQV